MLQQKNNVIAKNAACFLTARIGIVPEAVIEKGRFNILCYFLKPILGTNVFYSNVHFFLNVITCKYIFYTLATYPLLCLGLFVYVVLRWIVSVAAKIFPLFLAVTQGILFSTTFGNLWHSPSLYCILSIGDWDCDLHYEDKLAELMEAWVWNSTIVENNFKKWFKDSTHFRPIWGRV